MADDSCIFCSIAVGDAPAEVVWRDAEVVAFLDISPATDGHVLVVPVAHSVALTDLPAPTAAHMMVVAQSVARALLECSLEPQGINLFFAEGEVAFQEVFHSHLHVLPRYPDDGFGLVGRWEGALPEQRRQWADAIRALLPQQ